MRNVYSLELLRNLHLANYVYFNEEFEEIYAWFNGPNIKIFNYIGDEIGHTTIINEDTKNEYNIDEEINFRDVTTSIDSIVRQTYSDEA